MNRIEDLTKVKLAQGWVLIRIHLKESRIITPDSKEKSGPQVDYADAIAVAKDIEDIIPGDIVLDFRTTEGFEYHGEQYALVPRMSVKVVVERSNFNFDGIPGRKAKRNLTN